MLKDFINLLYYFFFSKAPIYPSSKSYTSTIFLSNFYYT